MPGRCVRRCVLTAAPQTANAVRESCRGPGSKSGTNWHRCCPCRGRSVNGDGLGVATATMVDALRALGVNIEASGPVSCGIMPAAFPRRPGRHRRGLMRSSPPVGRPGRLHPFHGDPQATTRPMPASGRPPPVSRDRWLPFTLGPRADDEDSEVVMDSPLPASSSPGCC